MASITQSDRVPGPVYWLALGAFAIGTEGFMISPLLPSLASDLGVSIQHAGQLVTVFAFAYGISSPVLTALTGGVNRRSLLLGSMIAFALSNLLAFVANSFWSLMAARVLLALSAGLFVPGSNALAGSIAMPERRGLAIAVVNAGITIAIALGVPLGAIVGYKLGWRMTFAGVALLSSIAAAGVFFGVPKGIGDGVPTATIGERIRVGVRPIVLVTLLTTTLWATGAYTVYTYLSPLLTSLTGLQGMQISVVMFMWGFAAAIGVFSGGALSDRFGPARVIVPALALSGLGFFSLAVDARVLSPSAALWPALSAVVIWGLTHWAFYPAQQSLLIGISGVKVAGIALSLNASFMYIGFSLGAALGGVTLAHGSTNDLGLVAGLAETCAVILTLLIHGRSPQGAVSRTIA
ncbi:MFS transporter [Variovorax sp. Sphag1AA]|uniref:MFS transporter n=1 Tax=Variovorax sp. Sphag1AA TaxID=2587027 RepID=UPI0016199643|nr:MFS transporter [Variovorax sp. Sphag1AA]MBB3178796.1 putative MFS family arabinose efflux permease [Variovorax sp. Sphag1AA]